MRLVAILCFVLALGLAACQSGLVGSDLATSPDAAEPGLDLGAVDLAEDDLAEGDLAALDLATPVDLATTDLAMPADLAPPPAPTLALLAGALGGVGYTDGVGTQARFYEPND